MNDDFFEDDDLFGDEDDFSGEFEDFDEGDLEGGMDDATIQAVMAHEAEVERQMNVLQSRKRETKERVAAAQFLGGSGVPKAISALRRVYSPKREKDKKVRKAAEKALGQFKALDEAIGRDPGQPVMAALGEGRNAHIMELLQNIATGQAGGGGGGSRVMRMLNGLLVVTLVLLLALNFMPASDSTSDDDGTDAQTVDDPLTADFVQYQDAEAYTLVDADALGLLESLRAGLVEMRGAQAVMNTEFAAIKDGTAATCPLPVSLPGAVAMTREQEIKYFDIGDIMARYTIANTSLNTANTIHQTACDEAREPGESEVTQAQEALGVVTTQIITIEQQIRGQLRTVYTEAAPEVVETTVPEITTEPEVVSTPEITEEPEETAVVDITPEDEPGLTDSEMRGYVQQLVAVISQVNGTRGAASTLSAFWQDIETSGSTGGCALPRPIVPFLDPLPQDIAESGIIELQTAWTDVRAALDLLRNGWNLFQDACTNNNLGDVWPQGKATVDTATQLLSKANQTLFSLR